jgi:23S rRNA (guanosine2251-2'-O)-methyltransferase
MQKLRNDELERLSVDEFRTSEKLPVCVVLDNVRSALNVGSIFRTADAFRLMEIVCCGITPLPPHRDILKSALGATDSVSWSGHADTLTAVKALKERGYLIGAVEQTVNSVKLNEVTENFKQPVALVFGHEMEGVSQDVIDQCDFTLEIEQGGTKHSLNISVCAGIVIWQFYTLWVRQHVKQY